MQSPPEDKQPSEDKHLFWPLLDCNDKYMASSSTVFAHKLDVRPFILASRLSRHTCQPLAHAGSAFSIPGLSRYKFKLPSQQRPIYYSPHKTAITLKSQPTTWPLTKVYSTEPSRHPSSPISTVLALETTNRQPKTAQMVHSMQSFILEFCIF